MAKSLNNLAEVLREQDKDEASQGIYMPHLLVVYLLLCSLPLLIVDYPTLCMIVYLLPTYEIRMNMQIHDIVLQEAFKVKSKVRKMKGKLFTRCI
jgi:hypothetical protein